MSKLEVFRDFITQRLTTATLEIYRAAEKSFADFEEEIARSKEESARLQMLLDMVTQPEIKIHRADVQQLSLPEPPQIKEEQELWTIQEEKQLQGLQSETTDSMFTSTTVKHDSDQEGFSECSHLEQTYKVENREGDSLPSNITEEQIKAEPDGQDYAAPEPGGDSQPFSVVAPDCSTAQNLEEEEHGGVLEQTYEVENREGDSLPSNTTEEQIKAEPDGQDYAAPKPGSDSQPLSVVAPDCSTAESLEEEEHGGVLLFQNRKNIKAQPRENMAQRRHTGKTMHQCQQCNNTFSTKSILVIHMRTHTGEKPYQCQICNKRFANKGNLVGHMRTHTGEKPYQCQECSKRFSVRSNLIGHLRTHTGEKPYQCQECSKHFSQRCSLDEHMRTHTGEKPYECQRCNKRFAHKGNLVEHMRVHTGEKPYKCQQCNNTFSQKINLVNHMRTHTGDKPYKCQECSKLFAHSRCLGKHMRTHSGEKPYQCQVCSKLFSQSGSLYRHMKTHR